VIHLSHVYLSKVVVHVFGEFQIGFLLFLRVLFRLGLLFLFFAFSYWLSGLYLFSELKQENLDILGGKCVAD